MEDHEDAMYMREAIGEAEAALKDDQLPVGSVVVLHGEIIGRGRKSVRASSWRLDHAEMHALREAMDGKDKLTREMTIYTTLEPCVMCFGAILNSRISRVVYALEDPYGGATLLESPQMPERYRLEFPQIVGGVMRKEALSLFRDFFKNTKNEYWRSHNDNPLVKLCVE